MSNIVSEKATLFIVVALIGGILLGSMGGFLLFSAFNPGASTKYEGNVVEIQMTAYQWGFDPDTIKVNLNDKVILYINSTADKEAQYPKHSFMLNDFNINVDLPVGKVTKVEFIADKAGEFIFQCGIFCGTNHAGMIGKLIVTAPGGEAETEEETLNPQTYLYKALGTWNVKDMMIVVERENRSIVAIDGKTHEKIGEITGLGYQPHTMVFHHYTDTDKYYGYMIGRGGWFVKFNLETLEVEGFVKVGTSSRGTAITTDGRYVVVTNYEPYSFVIVDAATMKIVKEYQVPVLYENGTRQASRVASVVDTPDNLMIVSLKELGEVWVLNMSESDFPIIKIFRNVGEVLHDAFLSADGRYYFLASQKSDWIWVMDTTNLTEVARIPTGDKPHPGPGGVWGDYAFSPSIGEGKLAVWNLKTFQLERAITGPEIGPGLFVRSYTKDMENYSLIWWDTVLDKNATKNRYIHVLNASTLNDPNPQIWNILTPYNNSLHPEFTYDGKYVYISCWQEDGRVLVYESLPGDDGQFDIVAEISGIRTPTGIFNVGLRLEEVGL